MLRKSAPLMFGLVVLLTLNGCMVAKDKYLQKADEADRLGRELSTLTKSYEALRSENTDIIDQVTSLQGDVKALQQERQKLQEDLGTTVKERDKLSESLTALTKERDQIKTDRDELDRVLRSRT
ncbi:MAG: hypothetical protein PHY31_01850, partial [Smithellaceae bacterium]|nr:hypothetical protein [Smithellaceae bacterium]